LLDYRINDVSVLDAKDIHKPCFHGTCGGAKGFFHRNRKFTNVKPLAQCITDAHEFHNRWHRFLEFRQLACNKAITRHPVQSHAKRDFHSANRFPGLLQARSPRGP